MERKACKFYFEFCENKDLVIGKRIAWMCLLMWKLSQNEEYIGTFKKHVETLHCIVFWYNARKSRKMLENVRKCRETL